jgi:hypothetical protein
VGGWVTGVSARQQALTSTHEAVVTALAPFCAGRFRAQADRPAQIAALAKSSSWERGTGRARSASGQRRRVEPNEQAVRDEKGRGDPVAG